ncbi:cation:proton antiporter [Micromonospora sp. NBC_00898]|uniref:cation:proton antiporter domain-containing protein n=1 Tax=Micromonospora sp. NBC_00898 TaxID=2975981 RepID=UPI00386F71EC|nr:cation:proton antiporter [Micromonospora sp. NBC_00898]
MSTTQATRLLLALAIIIVAARALGALARRLDQPPVIGEVLAGIALGPTLLHGAVSEAVFPTDIRPFLAALANLGIALFMFIVGLELDHALARGRGRLAGTVSISSIVLPFGLGALLSLYLIGNHPSRDPLSFALFMGAAMSVTAFPVLARILTDRNMSHTVVGQVALTCAAVDDVLAWTMLATVVTVAGAAADQARLLLLVPPYLVVMFLVVRPLLRRVAVAQRAAGRLTSGTLAVVLAGALLSAAATEAVGLHFIFGAFLFGVVMPREGGAALRAELLERVGQVSSVLLLPVFFIVAGLRVDLSAVGATGLGELALILLVAIGGKFAGAFLAARANGLPARESGALATLMNTRGLTELVILNIGLQLTLLDTRLYSLMVVMAVLTTAMAGPLLRLLYPRRRYAPAAPVPAAHPG